jgi:hypothetical protein
MVSEAMLSFQLTGMTKRMFFSDRLSSYHKEKERALPFSPHILQDHTYKPGSVSTKFSNLHKEFEKYTIQCRVAYNADETAVTTGQNPTRILARKVVKLNIASASTDRGFVVTMVVTVRYAVA